MPLSEVQTGQRVKLQAIRAGRGLRARLAAMGLIPGAELKVVSNSLWGPLIIGVKESRVILGRGVTQRIEVA